MGPLYPRTLRDQLGFASEVDALLDANRDGAKPRLPRAAERLAAEVTVMATYDEAPAAIAAWLGAGADTIDLVLPPGVPEQPLHEMLEAAAPGTLARASDGIPNRLLRLAQGQPLARLQH